MHVTQAPTDGLFATGMVHQVAKQKLKIDNDNEPLGRGSQLPGARAGKASV